MTYGTIKEPFKSMISLPVKKGCSDRTLFGARSAAQPRRASDVGGEVCRCVSSYFALCEWNDSILKMICIFQYFLMDALLASLKSLIYIFYTIELSIHVMPEPRKGIRLFSVDVSNPFSVTTMAHHYTIESIEYASCYVTDFWRGHKDNWRNTNTLR